MSITWQQNLSWTRGLLKEIHLEDRRVPAAQEFYYFSFEKKDSDKPFAPDNLCLSKKLLPESSLPKDNNFIVIAVDMSLREADIHCKFCDSEVENYLVLKIGYQVCDPVKTITDTDDILADLENLCQELIQKCEKFEFNLDNNDIQNLLREQLDEAMKKIGISIVSVSICDIKSQETFDKQQDLTDTPEVEILSQSQDEPLCLVELVETQKVKQQELEEKLNQLKQSKKILEARLEAKEQQLARSEESLRIERQNKKEQSQSLLEQENILNKTAQQQYEEDQRLTKLQKELETKRQELETRFARPEEPEEKQLQILSPTLVAVAITALILIAVVVWFFSHSQTACQSNLNKLQIQEQQYKIELSKLGKEKQIFQNNLDKLQISLDSSQARLQTEAKQHKIQISQLKNDSRVFENKIKEQQSLINELQVKVNLSQTDARQCRVQLSQLQDRGQTSLRKTNEVSPPHKASIPPKAQKETSGGKPLRKTSIPNLPNDPSCESIQRDDGRIEYPERLPNGECDLSDRKNQKTNKRKNRKKTS